MPKMAIATRSSTRVRPRASRIALFASHDVADEPCNRAVRLARGEHLDLHSPEARIGRPADGLAPYKPHAGLISIALARADVGPERPDRVLRQPVLRDPASEQPFLEIRGGISSNASRSHRHRERNREDGERDKNFDQREAAGAVRHFSDRYPH